MHEYFGSDCAGIPRSASPAQESIYPDQDFGYSNGHPALHSKCTKRTDSWSVPGSDASSLRHNAASAPAPSPLVIPQYMGAPPFSARAPPKRTMTDDAQDAFTRPMNVEWTDDNMFGWPSVPRTQVARPNVRGGDPFHAPTLPTMGSIHRAQTIDTIGIDAQLPGAGTFASGGFGLPGGASPLNEEWSPGLMNKSFEWGPRGREAKPPWLARRAATVSRPARSEFSNNSGGIPLSSSPDDDAALLHQQHNAETSVAIALGDDEIGANIRKLSLSPPRHGAAPVEQSLTHEMRSMTLPTESGIPSAELSNLFMPGGSVIGSPNGMRRNPGRRDAYNSRNKSAHPISRNAFSSPFNAHYDLRSSTAASTPTELGGPYFSPPYSPDRHTLARDDEMHFGTFAQMSSGPLDQPQYRAPATAPHSRNSASTEYETQAWFGAPGTLRLGDLKPSAPPSHEDDGEACAAAELASTHHSAPNFSQKSRRDRSRDARQYNDANDANARRHPLGRRNEHWRGQSNHDGAPARHANTRMGRHANTDDTAHELPQHFALQDVVGHMVEISTDQHGSRLIQEKLDHCSKAERDMVFNELYPESRHLMTDVFGNYVIQKLLEYGSPMQVHALGEKLKGYVMPLSLGTYGCRVVQKAFEHVCKEQKISLGQELEPYVLDCVRDQNANHVIQKILEQVPSEHLDFISTAFRGHVPALASHCYSCRVLQRIFAYCSEEQRRPLLDEMHKDTLRLMQDQYGNYVIQWVLQRGENRDRAEIVQWTKRHLLQLARHKFASNVVEHVIQVASPQDLQDLQDELFAPTNAASLNGVLLLPEGTRHCVATVMMQDQYANYVLQRFLQTVQGEGRKRLIATISPALQALRQMAVPASGSGGSIPHAGSVRLPGGGHIGSKPLLTIERLIEQVSTNPESTPHTHPRSANTSN